MGKKIWYLDEDRSDSSYTDFTAVDNSSSYTDFTAVDNNRGFTDFTAVNINSSYTDFTVENNSNSSRQPVKRRAVRKAPTFNAPVRQAKMDNASACQATLDKAPVRRTPSANAAPRSEKKKKRSFGRAFVCTVAALSVVLASTAAIWYYIAEIEGNDIFDSETVFAAAAKKRSRKLFADIEPAELAAYQLNGFSDKTSSNNDKFTYSRSAPAYEVACNLMDSLRCDDDVSTAWEIFNWVHSNITYQPMTTDLSFEDAAYRGFTRKSGDCFVYFACAKMLLDCAGIPNMAVERYPVYTNGHYWNLVQLDGEWYHCDATVFRDHPGMYFMCTDEEIGDDHHEFNSALYPERASYNSYYQNQPGAYQPDDYYDDWYDSDDDYSDDGLYYADEYYGDLYFDDYSDDGYDDYSDYSDDGADIGYYDGDSGYYADSEEWD